MLTRSQTLEPAHRGPPSASRAGIRLLGRLLGEIVSEQHGARAFQRIEDLRRHSVSEHRDGEADTALAERVARVALADMRVLIRAFSIFSQLANIADDHLARRSCASSSAAMAFSRSRMLLRRTSVGWAVITGDSRASPKNCISSAGFSGGPSSSRCSGWRTARR